MKYFMTAFVATSAIMAAGHAYADSYDDSYCREYTKTVYVGGRPQQSYGSACYQQDGSWRVVNGRNYGERVDTQYIMQPQQQVVYYTQPVAVYQPVPVYYSRPYVARPYYYNRYPSTYLSFSFGGRDRYDRHDRWDRGRRGPDRGRGHHH